MFPTRLNIVFLILFISAIDIKSVDSQSEDSTAFSIADDISTGKVLGIHQYTLREGVDPQEFERFVTKEWSPVVSGLFPGVQLMVMKGERGSHIGRYLIVYEISSLYVRNFYWPTPGEQTEAAQAIWKTCGDRCTQVYNRFNELAERVEWTDYVALLEK